MAGVQIGVRDPLPRGVLHAEDREAVQRPPHHAVGVHAGNTRRRVVVVVLRVGLRVPVAVVLHLVRRRVAPRVVERVVERHAGHREADHAHGQALRPVGDRRMGGNLEVQLLRAHVIGIGVVAVGAVARRNGKAPRGLTNRQPVALHAHLAAVRRERERRVGPEDVARDVRLLHRIPRIAVEPGAGVPRAARAKVRAAGIHVARGGMVGNVPVTQWQALGTRQRGMLRKDSNAKVSRPRRGNPDLLIGIFGLAPFRRSTTGGAKQTPGARVR